MPKKCSSQIKSLLSAFLEKTISFFKRSFGCLKSIGSESSSDTHEVTSTPSISDEKLKKSIGSESSSDTHEVTSTPSISDEKLKNGQFFYEKCLGLITNEVQMLNSRTLFLCNTEGLLFASYGLCLRIYSDHETIAAFLFVVIIPFVGALTAFTTLLAIRALENVLDKIEKSWDDYLVRQEICKCLFPPLRGMKYKSNGTEQKKVIIKNIIGDALKGCKLEIAIFVFIALIIWVISGMDTINLLVALFFGVTAGIVVEFIKRILVYVLGNYINGGIALKLVARFFMIAWIAAIGYNCICYKEPMRNLLRKKYIMLHSNSVLYVGLNQNGVVEDHAHNGHVNLTSVVIPSNLKGIGAHAFSGCTELTTVSFVNVEKDINESELPRNNKEVQDETGIEIGSYAFSGCSKLASIIIPKTTKRIGDHAFDNCTSLVSIVIPEGLETIGDHAFSDCKNLSSIVIPNSVKEIGDHAFSGCSGLRTIAIPALVDEKNKTADNPAKSPARNPASNGMVIKNYAFSGCFNLTSIVIPDNVEKIGDHAFRGCEKIVSLIIPDSVKEIGDHAFVGCSELTTVAFLKSSKSDVNDSARPDEKEPVRPNEIKIGNYAFSGCTKLRSVLNRDEIRIVGDNAFVGSSYEPHK